MAHEYLLIYPKILKFFTGNNSHEIIIISPTHFGSKYIICRSHDNIGHHAFCGRLHFPVRNNLVYSLVLKNEYLRRDPELFLKTSSKGRALPSLIAFSPSIISSGAKPSYRSSFSSIYVPFSRLSISS